MADIDPLAARALKLVETGRREQRERVRRYDHAYNVYRVTEAPRPAGRAKWQSNLRVPYAQQVINTALVNMINGKPRIKVTPRHPDGEISSKAMQYVLDYYVQEDHLVESQAPFVQQALVYGVTAAKNHWLYQTTDRRGWEYRSNPMDGSLERRLAAEKVVTHDRPTFEPWDVYHLYWEPGARSVDDAAYVVLQSYLSADELRKLAHNTDTGQGIYHNVEDLIAAGMSDKPEQSAQNRIVSESGARYKDKFLVEEIWTDESLVVVGNGHVLLRGQSNPYWHGKKPIVITQTQPDLFEMVGVSETELIDDLQQAQHTLQNMVVDNLHLTVMRGITYREGGVTNPNDLELRPRFKWPVSDHDDIRPFEVQPIASDVFTERQRLLADMQLVTGINPYVSGSDLQSVDQNTATGVTALQDVASRLLRFKAGQIAYKGYQRSYEMWGDMVQQFLDHDVAVKVTGPGSDDQWLNVSPEDVAGHFAYHLEGTEESLSRQQERGEAIALLNAFAPLAQLGTINFKPILEKVAEAYGFPNPESLFNQPPPQQAAAPTPDGQQQGGPGPTDPFFNVRSPQIGAVPQRNSYLQQGGLQLDPRLAHALGRIQGG